MRRGFDSVELRSRDHVDQSPRRRKCASINNLRPGRPLAISRAPIDVARLSGARGDAETAVSAASSPAWARSGDPNRARGPQTTFQEATHMAEPKAVSSAAEDNSIRLDERLWVDPRTAIQERTIVCLVCLNSFRQITNTHLRYHGLTALAYKAKFGYNRGRPLMCHALRRAYADRAVRSQLASRIVRRPILSDPELRRRGGQRVISLEERLTRSEAHRPRPPDIPRRADR
jgi:predicted transcriptional regulator